MRFAAVSLVSAVFGAVSVAAENFVVAVGKGGALTYDPPSVNAKVGDTIEFQFLSKNHTVTQSTFTSPCVSKADGVDSGYQFVPANAANIPSWTITINNDAAPLWFYCAQGAHCKAGMVFAVNPNAEKTYEAFVASAAAGGGATSGPNAAGGAASAPAGSSASATVISTPQTVSGAAPTAAVTLVPAAPAAPAANAANTPAQDSPIVPDGTTANQENVPDVGSALASRSIQSGWMLAGAMGVVALML